jgi:hypothetical protein
MRFRLGGACASIARHVDDRIRNSTVELKRCVVLAFAVATAMQLCHASHAEPFDGQPGNATRLTPLSGPAFGLPQLGIAPIWRDRPDNAPPPRTTPDLSGLDLAPAVLRISRIASWNGDRIYVVVDKMHGKLVLFENGRPTLTRPALTGESLADRLPADAIARSVHDQHGVKYKVTPAGRFTLSHAFDRGLGRVLDINEIHGLDWGLAIHRVWLGNSAERRDARLRSVNDSDKHITTGCIDVEADTMHDLLLRLSASDRTPIYILPTDESLIDTLFQPRDLTAAPATPSGTPLWRTQFRIRPMFLRMPTFLR